ncbi:MAG: hypothetical protein Q7J07_07030 [Pelolinea sp.]|nr:hypothetical protein [Pelolinea sp.]
MPSLWCAVAGDRPVPNNHDDPGHITWRWKDDLIGKRKWYYSKVLRRKSTIISLDLIPNFFALTPSVHDGLEEILFHYKKGSISIEEKFIFQQLSNFGPSDTIELRKKLSASFTQNVSSFNRALELLQRDLRITPSGISRNGRWKYSYIYQTVSREFPDLVELSNKINKEDAILSILRSFFRSNGIGTIDEINKLFRWQKETILDAISALISNCEIIKACPFWDAGEEIYSIPELI